MTIYSDPGAYLGQGQARYYDPSNGRISVSGNLTDLVVNVHGGNTSDAFSMDFGAPPNETLHRGSYGHAERAAFRNGDSPGIDISRGHQACNKISGRFDIKDIKTKPDGTITELWLTYEQHCEGQIPALFGEVRYHVPLPSGDLQMESKSVWFPNTYPGRDSTEVPITIRNTGVYPIAVVASGIRGENSGDFHIGSNDCKGNQVPPGQVCQINVGFAPTGSGPRIAELVVKDSTGARHSVSLVGRGIRGTTYFNVTTYPTVYFAKSYDVTNATFSLEGGPSYVHATITGDDGDLWTLQFHAPPGTKFSEGSTYQTDPSPQDSSTAGMWMTGDDEGNCFAPGTLELKDFSVTANKTIRHLKFKFHEQCLSAGGYKGVLTYKAPSRDTHRPHRVSNVQLVRHHNRADVSWNNPSDHDLSFVIVRYLQGNRAPNNPISGLPAFAGLGRKATIHHLDGNGLSIAIYTVDDAGNVSRIKIAHAP